MATSRRARCRSRAPGGELDPAELRPGKAAGGSERGTTVPAGGPAAMQAAAFASALSQGARGDARGGPVPASVFDVLLALQLERSLSGALAALYNDGVGELFPQHARQLRSWSGWVGAAAGALMHSATLGAADASVFEALAGLARAPVRQPAGRWRMASLLLLVAHPVLRGALEEAASSWRRQRDESRDDGDGDSDSDSDDERAGPAVHEGDGPVADWAAGAAGQAEPPGVADAWGQLAGGIRDAALGWAGLQSRALLGGPPTALRVRDALPALLLAGLDAWSGLQLGAFAMGASPHPTPLHWAAGCTAVAAGGPGPRVGRAPAPGAAVSRRRGGGAAAWAAWAARLAVLAGVAALQLALWRRAQRQRRAAAGDGSSAVPEHVRRRPKGIVPPPPAPPRAVLDRQARLARASGRAERAEEEAPAARRSVAAMLALVPGSVPLPLDPRLCPLTLRPMVAQTALPSGMVFDREAIQAYVSTHRACPVTGAVCEPAWVIHLVSDS